MTIVTAKLNDVDPRAWLAHVLRTSADQPTSPLIAWLISYRGIGSLSATSLSQPDDPRRSPDRYSSGQIRGIQHTFLVAHL